MKTFRKYFDLELKESDNNFGITIQSLGHHIHPENTDYPDQSHPDHYYFDWEKGRNLKEYQILYIPKGNGLFEANGMSSTPIAGGSLVLLFPSVWHRYKPNENTGWEEYWVGFSGSYADYLLAQECFSPQKPILKVGFNNEFLSTFSKLIDVVESKDESVRRISSFLLIQLLGIVYTSALMSTENRSKKEEFIHDILKEIHENWNKPIDFESISAKNNISYVWFRKSFKEVTQTSPNQYLLMLRIRKAEQMIQETNDTLSEIAFKSGFESESYFSRIFKKKMGYKPSDARGA